MLPILQSTTELLDQKKTFIRPEADTKTVESLVHLARHGRVRVPIFQRALKWEAANVKELFDSIYKGYPIGSLLLRKGSAEAISLPIGPITIAAPEIHDALWVIDGQQRMTALTASLSRPIPIPKTPEDPYVLYFNAAERAFEIPSKSGQMPDTWVPVAQLLDASSLNEWVFNWEHRASSELRGAVFEAGTRIRQYPVPLYIIDTSDENLLREIFFRTNNSGKSLTWNEVHDALFGHIGDQPSTLATLAEELRKIGMGRPSEAQLLSCLMAYQGLDITRNIAEHYRGKPDVLRNVVRDSLPSLRQALSFLRQYAEIPHLRLLPRSLPLVILTHFFKHFPDPNARTLQLLSRWTWRTLLGAPLFDERTLVRSGVVNIDKSDEEAGVQYLINLVPKVLPEELNYKLPSRFDARAAGSRLALLGMTSWKPIRSDNGQPVDVAALIEDEDVSAFRSIVSNGGNMTNNPANRILLPGAGTARKDLLDNITQVEFWHSHGIAKDTIDNLRSGDAMELLIRRRDAIETAVRDMGERLAAWSRSDRSSLRYLLAQSEKL